MFFLIVLVYIITTFIQLDAVTEYFFVLLLFQLFNQVKRNANLVALVHSRNIQTKPIVNHVLVGHMQTSLDLRSVCNALTALAVPRAMKCVHFV
jgi:hypothetical protein